MKKKYFCVVCDEDKSEDEVAYFAHGYDYETEVVCKECEESHKEATGGYSPHKPLLD